LVHIKKTIIFKSLVSTNARWFRSVFAPASGCHNSKNLLKVFKSLAGGSSAVKSNGWKYR